MGCYNSSLKNASDDIDFQKYTFTKAKVVKIYDGDTYWVVAKHRGQLTKFKVRLYGVDTCEIKPNKKDMANKLNTNDESEIKSAIIDEKKFATEAKKFVSDLILDKIVDIQVLNINEKYGRLLVNINIEGNDLAELLIKNNHAKAYYGGTK